MRRLIVFQQDPHELLGTLDPLLNSAEIRSRYLNLARTPDVVPDVSKYGGLMIVGGPMNVDQTQRYRDLEIEVEAIRAAAQIHQSGECAWLPEPSVSLPG